jgi:hypothetical protein
MGLFGATRKVLIISWSIIFMVIGLVILVRSLPEPWRGIVDAGVVIGLGLGLLSIAIFFVQGLAGKKIEHDPCIPETER